MLPKLIENLEKLFTSSGQCSCSIPLWMFSNRSPVSQRVKTPNQTLGWPSFLQYFLQNWSFITNLNVDAQVKEEIVL